MNKSGVINFIVPKIRFGISSIIATSVDYILFFIGVAIISQQYLPWIQAFAYTCAVLVNFFLQKWFVFDLSRPATQSFVISMTFSVIGIGLSAFFIYLITKIPFFLAHLLIAKIVISAGLFFYNFYTKRFAFEKKGLFNSMVENKKTEH